MDWWSGGWLLFEQNMIWIRFGLYEASKTKLTDALPISVILLHWIQRLAVKKDIGASYHDTKDCYNELINWLWDLNI